MLGRECKMVCMREQAPPLLHNLCPQRGNAVGQDPVAAVVYFDKAVGQPHRILLAHVPEPVGMGGGFIRIGVDRLAGVVVEAVERIAEEIAAFLDRHHVNAGEREIAVDQGIKPHHRIAADVFLAIIAPFAAFGDHVAGNPAATRQIIQRAQHLGGFLQIAAPVHRGIAQAHQEQRCRGQHQPARCLPGERDLTGIALATSTVIYSQ